MGADVRMPARSRRRLRRVADALPLPLGFGIYAGADTPHPFRSYTTGSGASQCSLCFGWPDDPRHCACVQLCLCGLDEDDVDEDLLGLVWDDEDLPVFRPIVTVEIPGVSW